MSMYIGKKAFFCYNDVMSEQHTQHPAETHPYVRSGIISAEMADGLFVKWDDDKTERYFLRTEIPHGDIYHVGHQIEVDLNDSHLATETIAEETDVFRGKVHRTLHAKPSPELSV